MLLASSWSGYYQWTNPTKKDNGGKVKSLLVRVEETDEEWKREIYLVEDGKEYRVFPVIRPTDPGYGDWHKYGEDSPEAESFRYNNKKINKVGVIPGKWMVHSILSTENESISSITVSAFNMKITLSSNFSFSLDENGVEQLTFGMDTDTGFAQSMFFTNPEKDSDGKFVLKKMK